MQYYYFAHHKAAYLEFYLVSRMNLLHSQRYFDTIVNYGEIYIIFQTFTTVLVLL